METIKDYKNLIGKKNLLKGISSIISVYGIYKSVNALNKCVENEENDDNMVENSRNDYINQNITNINKRGKKKRNTDITVLDNVSTEENINKNLEYLRNSLNSRISYHNTYNNLSDREVIKKNIEMNSELELEKENTELESEKEDTELGSDNEYTELESEKGDIELESEKGDIELESEKGNIGSESDNESLESFSWRINIDDLREYRNNFLLLQENNIISPINSLSYFMREKQTSFSDITEIYKLCNYDPNRPLTLNIFCAISHVIKNIQNGNKIPKSIPKF